MEIDLNADVLLITSGIAALTGVGLQMLVKPWLDQKKDKPWYGIVMNILAIVIGIGLAFIGLLIFSQWAFETVLWACVQGLVAAFFAVYGYEAWKNIKIFVAGSKG